MTPGTCKGSILKSISNTIRYDFNVYSESVFAYLKLKNDLSIIRNTDTFEIEFLHFFYFYHWFFFVQLYYFSIIIS